MAVAAAVAAVAEWVVAVADRAGMVASSSSSSSAVVVVMVAWEAYPVLDPSVVAFQASVAASYYPGPYQVA